MGSAIRGAVRQPQLRFAATDQFAGNRDVEAGVGIEPP